MAADPRNSASGRPLSGRLALLVVYLAGVAGFLARHRRGRPAGELPERLALSDLALTAVATHKVSRTIAKEKIAAPLREPFAEFEGDGELPAEERARPSAQGPIRRGIGELITCPYCLDVWVGTGFAAGLVEMPRQTRFLAGVLSAVTASDFLQAAYRRATAGL